MTARIEKIIQRDDNGALPNTELWPTPGTVLIESWPASPAGVQVVLDAGVDRDDENDGRSEWRWFRLPEGTLILGCFPHGETYFAAEPFFSDDFIRASR